MQHIESDARPAKQSKGPPAKAKPEKAVKAGSGPINSGKLLSSKKKQPAPKATVEAAMIDLQDAAIQQQIAVRAYELWEKQGRAHGQDLTHWRQAEQEIRELLQDTVSQKEANAKQSATRSRR